MNDLRIKSHRRGKQMALHIHGKPVTAYAGETLFAVLLADGMEVVTGGC